MGYVSRKSSGPPAWLIFLVGTAFVFAGYYVWTGVRTFIQEGARINPTQQAILNLTATVEQRTNLALAAPTRRPTFTPIPECQDYFVDTPTLNIREQPSINSRSLELRYLNDNICVLILAEGTDWFLIDRDTSTLRVEPGYVRSDLVRALRPSPTPSPTNPPPPSVTPQPTYTPSLTPTQDPDRTNTPFPDTPAASPTITPTPTPVSINL